LQEIKSLKYKKYFQEKLSMKSKLLVAVIFLFLQTSCVFSPNFLDDGTDEDVNEIIKHDGEVFLIGSLTGDLADELNEAITFTAYDNASDDAPIVFSGDSIDGLTDQQKAGVLAAYEAHQPIVLIWANSTQIDSLNLLLQDNISFEMPEGFDSVEVYAVDMEPEGDAFEWIQYPPSGADVEPDDEDDQEGRSNVLVEWLGRDGERMLGEESAKIKNMAVSSGNDLMQLSSAFVNQQNFSKLGNNYQISHYIYSCHSLETNDDWFYVLQSCVFNAKGAYTGTRIYAKGSSGWYAKWYLDNIELDSYMVGYDNDSAKVGLQQSSPETANHEVQLTSGITWNVGGELAADKNGIAGKITGGISVSNSKTFSVRDCEVTNQSIDRGSNAHWYYQFARSDSVSHFHYASVTEPPALSTSTFQPVNQWVWRMVPALRNAAVPLRVKLKVQLVSTQGIYQFLWKSRPNQTTQDGGTWTYDIKLKYPPLTASQ
jgi:hypothetical protein